MEDIVEYVKRSKYRRDILKSIAEDAKIPSQISKDTGILQNHISSILNQLKKENLIVCVNPEVKKGRVYRLTDYGENIINKIK